MIIILMGVSGAGKTTIGKLFAEKYSWTFLDADDFHSAASINKMRRGIPLTDADRIPWLTEIRTVLIRYLQENQNIVLACSALRQKYRELLTIDANQIKFVYLQVNAELISQRLQARQNHFMSVQLLESQLDSLEEPEHAIVINGSSTPDAIAQEIWHKIN